MSIIKIISAGTYVARQPVSEDLMTRIVTNETLLENLVINTDTLIFAAPALTIAAGTIEFDTPTVGELVDDNQYKDMYVHFTSGALFSANANNRYKLTATSTTLGTMTVAENLSDAGGAAADTYVIIGHSHDGSGDGSKIDLKDHINILEDSPMTQNLADALTDPDGNRTDAATKANPLITAAEAVDIATAAKFIWTDDSTTFGLSGSADISSVVPVGTSMVEVYIAANTLSASPMTVTGKVSLGGGNREIMKLSGDGTNAIWGSTTAMLPVDGDRKIYTGLTGPIISGNLSVRTYQ